MERILTKCLDLHCTCYPFSILHRCLSSAEVSTALRPFYFSVHPDLFWQYPSEKNVNENSLKLLNSYLTLLQQKRPSRPVTVTFYLRNQCTQQKKSHTGSFHNVKINLTERDVRKAVLSILRTCNLPTTYVDSIEPPSHKGVEKYEFRFTSGRNSATYSENISTQREYTQHNKSSYHLRSWLQKNVSVANEKRVSSETVQTEIFRLKKDLTNSLELQDILWDRGWNVAHLRGCLVSFQSLAKHHSLEMKVLKGRTLMFGSETGVSLDGHIILNSGEVRSNWLDFLKNVKNGDAAVLRIPAFERAASCVLRDIQIVRRKFQPQVTASNYETSLRRLTTSLSDYQGLRGYPKNWPESLSDFQLVVETAAGPLMLSPTGQFIVPSSCPGSLLINFINKHMNTAAELLQKYKSNKYVERALHGQCVSEFSLTCLRKDDNITPDLMIKFCKELLSHKAELAPLLVGARLWVTNYYSVLSDGDMCIPWNWEL